MKTKLISYFLCSFLMALPGFSQELNQLKLSLKKASSDTARVVILSRLIPLTSDEESEKYTRKLRAISEYHLNHKNPVQTERAFYRKHLAISLNYLGSRSVSQGNYEQAMAFHKQAETIARKNADPSGIATALLGFGNINYYFEGNLNRAMDLYRKSLTIYSQAGDRTGIANALGRIGVIYSELGKSDQALLYYTRSLKLHQNIGNKNGIAQCFNNIGLVYHNQGNIPKALVYYRKSLQIKEQIGNKGGIASSLNSLGIVYFDQHDFTNALDFFQRALTLREEIGQKEGIAASLGNIGVIYHEMGNDSKAFYYFRRALRLDEEIGDKAGIAASLNNLGDLYMKEKNYSKSLEQHLKALQIQEEINEKEGIAASLINIGEIYREQGKYLQAIESSERSLKIAQEIGYFEPIRNAANSLYQTYKKLGKTREALTNFELYIQMRDSVSNEENRQASTELKYRYEYEKKTAEDRVRDAEEKKVIAVRFKQEQTQRYALYGGLSLLTLFGGFMFNRFRVTNRQKRVIEAKEKETQEQNVLISQQKQEVELQKNLVETKQKEILDSIAYAKRLQEAILPPLSSIQTILPESFVFYKPKDLVAGDFYWSEQSGDLFFIAAADSTGHGVPGAMVSVVCSNALNRSVKEFGLNNPGQILDKARELVVETFEKNNAEVKDGMDISLLCINQKTKQVSWSGANNPLWYIQSGELFEIKADKQPIGKSDNPRSFTTHILEPDQPTTFYLFTDGFADQFGGPKGKKFKYSQLKEYLLDCSPYKLSKQGILLENRLEEWKGNLEQVDDVCIIGLQIDWSQA